MPSSDTTLPPTHERSAPLDQLTFTRTDAFVDHARAITPIKAELSTGRLLSAYELSELYVHDDICATIVDSVVETAFGTGLIIKDDKDNKIIKRLKREGVIRKIKSACKWARLYGGSCLYLRYDDGVIERPVNHSLIKKYYNLVPPTVMWQNGDLYYKHIKLDPKRYVVFMGEDPPPLHERFFWGWGMSVIQRIDEIIREFGISWSAINGMIRKAEQTVWKIPGYRQAVAKGEEEKIAKRIQYIEMNRSVNRAVILDEDEQFEQVDANFSGLEGIIDKLMMRISSVAKIPVSILFGQGKATLSERGELDANAWRDRIYSYREEIEPMVEEVIQRVIGKDVEIEWPPLEVPTILEQSEARKKQAETDMIYIQTGVVLPEEIAECRWKDDGEFNHRTFIDPANPRGTERKEVEFEQQLEHMEREAEMHLKMQVKQAEAMGEFQTEKQNSNELGVDEVVEDGVGARKTGKIGNRAKQTKSKDPRRLIEDAKRRRPGAE
jgi:hypothetical protein